MAPPTIHADGRDVDVSRLDKEFYPEDHVSKGDVLDHYRAVADTMLPHLAGRPLTMRRFPDGIGAEGFFQKHASDHFPEWLRIAPMRQRGDGSVRHVVCDDEATLIYLVDQATIEFHVWLSTVDRPESPDRLVIDIDPPPRTEAATLHQVARRVRDLGSEIGLAPFLQATGGKGYHVVAPLDRSAEFDLVRGLAADMADLLVERDPDLLTTAQRKDKRGDRIFLDVNRNAYGQTFIAPYSLRARPGASVATPLDWSELGRSAPNGHTPETVRRRLAQKSDPWSSLAEHAAAPAAARERLDAVGR
ncbi:non-homologous end-joining DNA ligase [Glycomyces salinus]|uniref:non-homologous end-joining DNA ligase n=1 Tax=Glycomyces salinus TaxID=980294 RepID=UPI0018EE0C45|nr:non-homologous end-joining DNA ligase [Glycomyces salinus]